jgi:VanZ family protein
VFTRHSIFAWTWTAIVGLLCGLPGYSFPDLSIWAILSFDGAAHAFVFCVFSFLWAVSFYKSRSRIVMRFGVWPVLLFGIGYGTLIEILQYLVFVRRSAEWTDMLADAIGAGVGVLVFKWIYGRVIKTIAS